MMWRLAFALCFIPIVALAVDTPVPSRITAAKLFKNGIAFITAETEVPGPGQYEINPMPNPLHGSWWVSHDPQVETKLVTKTRKTNRQFQHLGNVEHLLDGSQVTLFFKDGLPEISGTVVRSASQPKDQTQHKSGRYDLSGRFVGHNLLHLTTAKGAYFVDPSTIAFIRTAGVPQEGWQVREEVPVLVFNVTAKKPRVVRFSYLVKGLAWAPSYHIELGDHNQLKLTQKAVIRNEWDDLANVPLTLISGYPNLPFQNVLSPLSAETSWQRFFQKLGQLNDPYQQNSYLLQQRAMPMPDATPQAFIPSTSAGTGDMHYQPAGKLTLQKGSALARHVATGQTSFKRLVMWHIPATRQPNGRPVQENYNRRNQKKEDKDPWDAIRFNNPLSFPLTTAPAMVVENGRLLGQSTQNWANPGAVTNLKITKALSLETSASERVEPGERPRITIGRSYYYKETVTGTLRVKNTRKKSCTISVQRAYSGKYIEADHQPAHHLLEEGVGYINQRNQIQWQFELKPGETKEWQYRYEVLVPT